MKITLKFYTTIFPLACRTLYRRKRTFFNFSVYNVVYKKSSTHGIPRSVSFGIRSDPLQNITIDPDC